MSKGAQIRRSRACSTCGPEEASPPIGLRCLTEQEVVDKLNAVPVFSIVNGADQMLATPNEDGELACRFYLEVTEAQATLAELRAANPRATLELAVTPLGTAFAMSEWQERLQDDSVVGSGVGIGGDLGGTDEYGNDGEYYDDEALFSSPFGSGEDGDAPRMEVAVRLQANQEEVQNALAALKKAPVPPLLRRQNRLEGPIPLFGSDDLRLSMPEEDALAAGAGAGSTTMLPLFFRRQDAAAAWVASGGAPDKLPPLQVTDLRTLAWQMRFSRETDWRPMLLVAPEPAIEFVKQKQTEAAALAATADAQINSLTPEDMRGLVFGGDDGPRRASG